MWDHLIRQPLPRHESSPPDCLSPPLLLVWMHVFSLTTWLSDLHTVGFSVSSGCFFFLNLLLSFFWLYEEAHSVSTYASILVRSLKHSFQHPYSFGELLQGWGFTQHFRSWPSILDLSSSLFYLVTPSPFPLPTLPTFFPTASSLLFPLLSV